MMPVFLLCGGYGRRLGALTTDTPKALVDVNGKSCLVRQLELLGAHGCTDVVLCGGHLLRQIELAIGDGTELGVRVRYCDDGTIPKGTGGAIRLALAQTGQTGPFLLLYGDVLLDTDYQAMAKAFDASGADAMMGVWRDGPRYAQNIQVARGHVVEKAREHVRIHANAIDAGVSACYPAAFAHWPVGLTFELDVVWQRYIQLGRLAAYEIPDRVYEIGSPDGLAEASHAFTR